MSDAQHCNANTPRTERTRFTHEFLIVERRILSASRLRGDLLAPAEERSAGPEPQLCCFGTIRYST